MRESFELAVSARLWTQMVEHAETDAPVEAVGLLGGTETGEVRQVHPLPNVAGPLSFFADPYAQYEAERAIAEANLVTLGYYHSHPGGGLDLSAADKLFAKRRDWVYVVLVTASVGVSVTRGAAYRWIEGALREVPLVVT
jgi:proteasome lid subunit RPN8/RPN11